MKTKNQYQDWILLEASGELSAWKRIRLRRMLARDPQLQAYREALRHYSTLIREAPLANEPSAFAMNQILRAGGTDSPALQQSKPWPLWRPALAYGSLAVALLVAGLLWLTGINGGEPTLLTEADVDYWMQSLFGSLEEVAWLHDASDIEALEWDL